MRSSYLKLSVTKSVHLEKAPAAVGPYSQAIEASGFVFTSGQLPVDPSTGKLLGDGIREQTRQPILNVREVLEIAGSDLSKVIRTMVYLSDVTNFGIMDEVYARLFTEPYPARFTIAIHTLSKEILVEVECVVVKG